MNSMNTRVDDDTMLERARVEGESGVPLDPRDDEAVNRLADYERLLVRLAAWRPEVARVVAWKADGATFEEIAAIEQISDSEAERRYKAGVRPIDARDIGAPRGRTARKPGKPLGYLLPLGVLAALLAAAFSQCDRPQGRADPDRAPVPVPVAVAPRAGGASDLAPTPLPPRALAEPRAARRHADAPDAGSAGTPAVQRPAGASDDEADLIRQARASAVPHPEVALAALMEHRRKYPQGPHADAREGLILRVCAALTTPRDPRCPVAP